MIDTHAHIDGEEYAADRSETIDRAIAAGVEKIFIPAIDLASSQRAIELSSLYPGVLYPMAGLHPEEGRNDWRDVLGEIRKCFASPLARIIAIGEIGLDFYWSRDYAEQQLQAFEQQVQWSVELRLPLMIHCRKAQNELVNILKSYQKDLPGGVFHCFTGNEQEARQLLEFDNFVLGIGGVLTFKKSHLPEVLPATVPLNRIVLETDSPYMAPVPQRGQRNEPAYVALVQKRLAMAYGVTEEEVSRQTNDTVQRLFHVNTCYFTS